MVAIVLVCVAAAGVVVPASACLLFFLVQAIQNYEPGLFDSIKTFLTFSGGAANGVMAEFLSGQREFLHRHFLHFNTLDWIVIDNSIVEVRDWVRMRMPTYLFERLEATPYSWGDEMLAEWFSEDDRDRALGGDVHFDNIADAEPEPQSSDDETYVPSDDAESSSGSEEDDASSEGGESSAGQDSGAEEDERKFDFVKGWVRESIGSDAAVSGWEFDGETLTINHEDDDEVEQYTLDEIGYNEEDNSDGGAASASAGDDSESTPAPEGDGGEEDECPCDTCGKSLKPEEQFSLSYGVLDSVMCKKHFIEATATFYAQAPSAAMAHPAFGAYSIPDGSTLDVEALLGPRPSSSSEEDDDASFEGGESSAGQDSGATPSLEEGDGGDDSEDGSDTGSESDGSESSEEELSDDGEAKVCLGCEQKIGSVFMGHKVKNCRPDSQYPLCFSCRTGGNFTPDDFDGDMEAYEHAVRVQNGESDEESDDGSDEEQVQTHRCGECKAPIFNHEGQECEDCNNYVCSECFRDGDVWHSVKCPDCSEATIDRDDEGGDAAD